MIEIIVIIGCLGLNALFACFEMAFVTVSKPQLRQSARAGVKAAERILSLRENPERTLSVIQVGITLVGMVSAAVGGAGAEESFAPLLERRLGLSENAAEAIAIISVVLPLTVLSVVLGELVPKTIALRNPSAIALGGARWIILADKFLSPLATLLESATKFVLGLVYMRPPGRIIDSPAPVEIDQLSTQTQQYVMNLVSVETRRLRDVMIPISDVNCVLESDSIAEVTAAVIRSGHTRLPVFREGKIIGLLHTKEFIAMLATSPEAWTHLIRPVITMHENALALHALRVMQDKRSHLLIVETADKGPLGIVTLEDIIEEIVGDIFDEDDDGRIRKLLTRDAKLRARPRR